MLELLRAEGVHVIEVDGWKSRRRPGGWHPVGVMNHHTASRNGCGAVLHGRPDLPGPLANVWVAPDGAVHVIAAGRCSHAGPGSSTVLSEVQQDRAPAGDAVARRLLDDTIGNEWFYSIEVENLGDGTDAYSVEQITALVAVNVGLCRAHGWTESRCVHHREWTRRKVDMSFHGDLRGLVALALASSEATLANRALLEHIAQVVTSEGRTAS